jgi:hypothetical protein
MTRSTTTRIPRSCAAATRSVKSSIVPYWAATAV